LTDQQASIRRTLVQLPHTRKVSFEIGMCSLLSGTQPKSLFPLIRELAPCCVRSAVKWQAHAHSRPSTFVQTLREWSKDIHL